MTGAEIAQIVVAVATLVTALGGVIVGIRNTRRIEEVHRTTNSLATRTEALARSTGMAEGNLEGRKEQTAERKEERESR